MILPDNQRFYLMIAQGKKMKVKIIKIIYFIVYTFIPRDAARNAVTIIYSALFETIVICASVLVNYFSYNNILYQRIYGVLASV